MPHEYLSADEDLIDGKYRLGPAMEGSTESLVFETEFGEHALPASIRIVASPSGNSEALVAQWREAGNLAHSNLLQIYAAGFSIFNEVPIVYVVTERATESLEGVLAERPLTGNEMREVLDPVLDALQYLHRKGYVHSRLVPSNILAVGNQLKLSSDSVVRVSDGQSAADDMRALGVLIVQAVTHNVLDNGSASDPQLLLEILQEVPEPFAEIVRHCIDPDPAARWTAGHAKARLIEADEAATVSMPQARQVERPAERNTRAEMRGEQHADAGTRSQAGSAKWIYGGVAALALLAVLMAMGRNKNSPANNVYTAPAIARQDQNARVAATVSAAARQQAIPSEPSKPHAFASVNPPSPADRKTPRAGERKKGGWSVIIATYNSREAAEMQMRAIAKKWPAFRVTVSNPVSDKAHYLLTLGENLGEEQAEAVRKRAVEAGLPRDTYIKRLM